MHQFQQDMWPSFFYLNRQQNCLWASAHLFLNDRQEDVQGVCRLDLGHVELLSQDGYHILLAQLVQGANTHG